LSVLDEGYSRNLISTFLFNRIWFYNFRVRLLLILLVLHMKFMATVMLQGQ